MRYKKIFFFLFEHMDKKSWWMEVSAVFYHVANTSQGCPRDIRPAVETAFRVAESGLCS